MIATDFFRKRQPLTVGRIVTYCLVGVFFIACWQSVDAVAQSPVNKQSRQQQSAASSYRTIEWVDLMPEDDLDALLNPPDYLDDIDDGSEQDRPGSQLRLSTLPASDDRYQQALKSARIMPEFDNQKIRIPGYIVPLEFGKRQLVTRFFLVPYFGACIHVPPPPPNQIIYGVYDKGIKVDHLQQAFWLTGVLKTTLTENDVATAAYTLQVVDIKHYTE